MKLRIEAVDSPSKSAHEFEDDVIVLGRDAVCDLSLPGVSAVSGRHAQIVLTTEGAFLSDVGSTNGTFINDRRVEGRIKVRPGDYFRLGHTGPSFKITEIDLTRSEPVPRFNPAPEPAVQVAILTEPDGHTAPLPSLARPRSEPRSRADSSAPPRPAPPTGPQGQTRMMVMSLQNKNRNLMLVAGGIVLVLFFSGVVASVFFHRKTSRQEAQQREQAAAQKEQEDRQREENTKRDAKAAQFEADMKKQAALNEGQLYEQVLRSSVCIFAIDPRGDIGRGSGSLIDYDNRLVLTAAHVAGENDRVVVLFAASGSDGKLIVDRATYMSNLKEWGVQARIVKRDPRRDLAVIQLEKLPEKVAQIRLTRESVRAQQTIYCLGGNPKGNEQGMWISSHGKVRQVYKEDGVVRIASDVTTNPGDSGAPIYDTNGHLVGVHVEGTYDPKTGRVMSNQNVRHVDIQEIRAFLPICYSALGKPWKDQ